MAAEVLTARPAVDRAAIPYAHWTLRVGRDVPAFGEIVSEYADLGQGIAALFLTPKGSVPTEPEKGCDVLKYMDRPPGIAVASMLPAMWDALLEWHPRIVCDDIRLDSLPGVSESGFSSFRCIVRWRPGAAVAQTFLTTVEFSRDGLLGIGTTAA